MSKHTPGPWVHVNDIAGSRVVAGGVGFSAPYRRMPGSGRCEQQIADNDLISAAPDLLESLVVAVESDLGALWLWPESAKETWMENARAAIQKARGGSR